jgi:tetratricopeptide (TPR) repeat protein
VGLLDAYRLLDEVEPGRYRVSGPGPAALLTRALALDSTNGDARVHLAWRRWQACDTAGAEREWRAALRFSPGSATLRRDYSLFLGDDLGRFQEALTLSREAAAIDPSSPWVLVVLAWKYIQLGGHDSALAVSERALALDSTQWVPNAVRGLVEAFAGRLDAGIAHMEAARRLGGDGHGLTMGSLGWAYGRAGRRQDALRIARLLAERVGRGQAARSQVAYVYAGLGDREAAFQWLAKPPQQADWRNADSFWQPLLDPLRSDPRFAPLATRRWCVTGG